MLNKKVFRAFRRHGASENKEIVHVAFRKNGHELQLYEILPWDKDKKNKRQKMKEELRIYMNGFFSVTKLNNLN